MIDDCYVNNFAQNQVSVVFQGFARHSQKCVAQIYGVLYGDAMFAPFGGTQTAGRKIAKHICR